MISKKVSELELTNICNLPIIPGTASDYNVINTTLMVAHGISAWAGSKSSIAIIYIDIVSILFDLIYASRARNWIKHLSALTKMMPAIIMMDRIKYRRMMSVYLREMKNLDHINTKIWEYFMNGKFSIQKNVIPFTAIGRDHW